MVKDPTPGVPPQIFIFDENHLLILKNIWVFAPRFCVLSLRRITCKGVYFIVLGKGIGGNTKLFAWISLSLAPCSIQ